MAERSRNFDQKFQKLSELSISPHSRQWQQIGGRFSGQKANCRNKLPTALPRWPWRKNLSNALLHVEIERTLVEKIIPTFGSRTRTNRLQGSWNLENGLDPFYSQSWDFFSVRGFWVPLSHDWGIWFPRESWSDIFAAIFEKCWSNVDHGPKTPRRRFLNEKCTKLQSCCRTSFHKCEIFK